LKEIKCSGCWDKVFTGGDRFKKSIELEQRRKIVPTTLQLVHHKTSGGTRFCHICSKYFCFCAENSRQRKQSLDLFCYETLEDNEQYSSPINVSIKTINLDNNNYYYYYYVELELRPKSIYFIIKVCIKFVFEDVGVGCVYNFLTQTIPLAKDPIWKEMASVFVFI
jgi:hypothetical protein